MARKPRFSPIGVTQHVIQRGNNRQNCFNSNSERYTYLNALQRYAKKYQVAIHAWVLMDNHVHILCTPFTELGVSKMMQALGRSYVMYFNRRNERSGTLWEGRFKASLVDSDEYLFQLYQYIEMNPVKAGIVNQPEQYRWSSYHTNALGKPSDLITHHDNYQALAKTQKARQQIYQIIFSQRLSQFQTDHITTATEKGKHIGAKAFTNKLNQRGQSQNDEIGSDPN